MGLIVLRFLNMQMKSLLAKIMAKRRGKFD